MIKFLFELNDTERHNYTVTYLNNCADQVKKLRKQSKLHGTFKNLFKQRLKLIFDALLTRGNAGGAIKGVKNHKLHPTPKLVKICRSKDIWEFHITGNQLMLYTTDHKTKIVWLCAIVDHDFIKQNESFKIDYCQHFYESKL